VSTGPAGSRLQALARRESTRREAALERCELCGEAIPSEHRHLMDLHDRELVCSCRACSLLFADPAAGAGR